MKLVFLLLLLVLLSNNSNALQCVNHRDPIIFTALNVTKAIEFVETLLTTEEYEVCYIVYEINYPANDFAVSFGEDISTVRGDANMDVYFKMKLSMASGVNVINPVEGQKKFYFKCNDEDACERHFWRNHIEAFVKEDSTILPKFFRSVLITEIQEKVQCTVQNAESQETCQGDACFLIYSRNPITGCAQQNQQETSIEFGILSKASVNANPPYDLAMEAGLLGPNYICQFDQCNNGETYDKLGAAFTAETLHLFSIRKAFTITLQEKETTKPEGESSSTLAVSPTTEGRSSSTSIVSQKPSISTSIFPEAKPTTSSFSTSTSKQTTITPRNNSILHFISMRVFILHSLFLIFF